MAGPQPVSHDFGFSDSAPTPRVLVVDDDQSASRTIVQLLRHCGYESDNADSRDAAVQRAATLKPDVIFVDVNAPLIDGLSLAHQVRKTPGFAATTLVAMTRSTDREDLSKAAAAGFDEFLCQPFSLADVSAIMARIRTKIAASCRRIETARHAAARSRAVNAASRRSLEEHWAASPNASANESRRVVLIGCDDHTARLLSNRLSMGRSPLVTFESLDLFWSHCALKGDARGDCLLIDTTDGRIDAFSLLDELAGRRWQLPAVVLIPDGDVRLAVRLMRAGAFDVIPKPNVEREVLEAMRGALEGANGHPVGVKGLPPALSNEECELLRAIGLGTLNKQIARDLEVSLRTIQFRRAALMQKLGARTRADLIRLAVQSGLCD